MGNGRTWFGKAGRGGCPCGTVWADTTALATRMTPQANAAPHPTLKGSDRNIISPHEGNGELPLAESVARLALAPTSPSPGQPRRHLSHSPGPCVFERG